MAEEEGGIDVEKQAEAGVSADRLREELICALCLDTLKEPRSLQCLHTFCEKCLERMQSASLRPNSIFCPECRAKTPLPNCQVGELPGNFKLKRLVEILTAEEKRTIIRKRSSLYSKRPKPFCPAHKDKYLEFYCDPCEAIICGQCVIDTHRMHGTIKYASEVIGSYVMELKQVLPSIEAAVDHSESSILDVKAEANKLDVSLRESVQSVDNYFANLHAILDNKKEEVLGSMAKQAKGKGKIIQKHISDLEVAVDVLKKTKLTVEDTIERQSEEIDLLLEEYELRGRIKTDMRLVEEEMAYSYSEEKFSSITPFLPLPTVEKALRSLQYNPLRQKKRSLTMNAYTAHRQRLGAVSIESPRLERPTRAATTPGQSGYIQQISGLVRRNTNALINIIKPISVVKTKSLIGPCHGITAFPYGVACSNTGTVLVTDAKHHLLRVLTPEGVCMQTVGANSTRDGIQFSNLKGAAIDEETNMFVLDGKNPGKLLKFSSSGELMSKVIGRHLINTAANLFEPNDIALLEDGSFLVTDGEKACVQKFDSTGKFLEKFGDITDMNCPAGIAANGNRVVVADKGNHCFYLLTAVGKFLKKVGGQQGTGGGELHTPFGVAFDRAGNIVVSDVGNHRISVFNAGGLFRYCFGCKGSQLGMFRTPRHLCFNHEDLLVVADEQNQRLQLFNLKNTN